MEDSLKFHVRHLRAAGVCMNGARDYFANKAWNWNDFLDDGMLVSKLDVETDTYAAKVAQAAREEHDNG